MSLVNLDKSVGLLRSSTSHDIIEYEPFEFSMLSIGILSPSNLEQGSFVLMDTHRSGTVPFNVLSKERDIHTGLFRYRLTCPEKEIDLAHVLEIDRDSGRLKFEREGSHLQYARFEVSPSVTVNTKTFGSMETYPLKLINVSRTGILLCSHKPFGVIPYIENTLLELNFNMGDQFGDEVIDVLGKVTRHYSEGMNSDLVRFFAVKFVDFNPIDYIKWEKIIEDVEENFIKNSQIGLAA